MDINVLFSFFWKSSFTRKIILSRELDLVSPSFSLKEINKYSEQIISKTKLKKSKFQAILSELKPVVKFIKEKDYGAFIKKALEVSPDEDDKHFFALALKLKLPLWSNDKELKKQTEVNVLNTEDIIDLVF